MTRELNLHFLPFISELGFTGFPGKRPATSPSARELARPHVLEGRERGRSHGSEKFREMEVLKQF